MTSIVIFKFFCNKTVSAVFFLICATKWDAQSTKILASWINSGIILQTLSIVALASCMSLSSMITFRFLCCVQQETEGLDRVHNQVLQWPMMQFCWALRALVCANMSQRLSTCHNMSANIVLSHADTITVSWHVKQHCHDMSAMWQKMSFGVSQRQDTIPTFPAKLGPANMESSTCKACIVAPL